MYCIIKYYINVVSEVISLTMVLSDAIAIADAVVVVVDDGCIFHFPMFDV